MKLMLRFPSCQRLAYGKLVGLLLIATCVPTLMELPTGGVGELCGQTLLPSPGNRNRTYDPISPKLSTVNSSQLKPYVQTATVRIGDITKVDGFRPNVIQGIGLVVGLNGTGGSDPVTRQSKINMLENMGLISGPDIRAAIRNNTQVSTNAVSVVFVRAEISPFARPGERIDVSVATIDNATSLQNGKLTSTELLGLDKKPYAVASGPVSLGGGLSAEGQAASVQKNAVTHGIVPRGGILEEVPCAPKHGSRGHVLFHLNETNMETAQRVKDAINARFPRLAELVSPRTIRVPVGRNWSQDQILRLIATIEDFRVAPDSSAKVVVNERNGTIIVNERVRLSTFAIQLGNITVTASETPQVSQPAPLSDGETTVVPRTQLNVFEDQTKFNVINATGSLIDLVQSLNALGVTAREMSGILQHIKGFRGTAWRVDFQINRISRVEFFSARQEGNTP